MQREQSGLLDDSDLEGQWLFILHLDQAMKANILESTGSRINQGQKMIYSELTQCKNLFSKLNVPFFIVVMDIENLYQLAFNKYYQDIYSKIKQVYLYDTILNGINQNISNRISHYKLLSIKQRMLKLPDVKFEIKLINSPSQFRDSLQKYKYWLQNRKVQSVQQLKLNSERNKIFSNFFILNDHIVRYDLTKFILKVRKYLLLPQSQINQYKIEFKKYVTTLYQQKYNTNNKSFQNQKELKKFRTQFKDYELLNEAFTYPLSLQFSKKIIYEYSKEGFYYKMANYSLRNKHSNYQTFELHQAILKAFSNQKLNQNKKYYTLPSLVVYHGGRISKSDLNKVKPKDYIMISFFLSTSLDRNIAQNYRNQSKNDGYLMIITIKGGKYPIQYLQKFEHGLYELKESIYKKQKQILFNCLSMFKVININQKQRIIYVEYGIYDLLDKIQKKQKFTDTQSSILDNLQYCYQGKDMVEVMSYAVQTRKQQKQLVQVIQKIAKQSTDEKQIVNCRQKLSNIYLKTGKIQLAQAQAKETIQNLSKSQLFNFQNLQKNKSQIKQEQLEKIDYIVNQTIYSSKNIVTIDKYDVAQTVLQQLSDKIQNMESPHLFAFKIKIQLQIAKTNIQKGKKTTVKQILDQIISLIQDRINYFEKQYKEIQQYEKQNKTEKQQIQQKKKKYDSELNGSILWKINQIQNIYLQSIRLNLQMQKSNHTQQLLVKITQKYKDLLKSGLKKKFKTFEIQKIKQSKPSVIEQSQKVIHEVFLTKYEDQQTEKLPGQKPIEKLQQTFKRLNKQRSSLEQSRKLQCKQEKLKQLEFKESNVIRQIERIHHFSTKFFSEEYDDLIEGNLKIKKLTSKNFEQSRINCKSKIKDAIQFYQDQNIESYHPKLIGLKVLQNQILMKSPQQKMEKRQQQITKCISNIQQLLCLNNRDKPQILERQKYIKYLWQHTEGAKAYYNLSKGYKLKGQYRKALIKCLMAQKICNEALVQKIMRSKSTLDRKQQDQMKKQLKQKMKINPLFLKIKLLKTKIYRKLKQTKKHQTQISNLDMYFKTYNEDIHKSSIEADIKEQKILNLILKMNSYNQQENLEECTKKYLKNNDFIECKQIIQEMITLRQRYLGRINIRNGVSYCKIITCFFNNTNIQQISQAETRQIIKFVQQCQKKINQVFDHFNDQNPQKWRTYRIKYDYKLKWNERELTITRFQNQKNLESLKLFKNQVQKYFCTDNIIRLQVLLQQQKLKLKENSLNLRTWTKAKILSQIQQYLKNPENQAQDFISEYNEKIFIYKQIVRVKINIIQNMQQQIKNGQNSNSKFYLLQALFQKKQHYQKKKAQIKQQKQLCQIIEEIIQEKELQVPQSSIRLQNLSSIFLRRQNISRN